MKEDFFIQKVGKQNMFVNQLKVQCRNKDSVQAGQGSRML